METTPHIKVTDIHYCREWSQSIAEFHPQVGSEAAIGAELHAMSRLAIQWKRLQSVMNQRVIDFFGQYQGALSHNQSQI